jgi:hypothetical protein
MIKPLRIPLGPQIVHSLHDKFLCFENASLSRWGRGSYIKSLFIGIIVALKNDSVKGRIRVNALKRFCYSSTIQLQN